MNVSTLPELEPEHFPVAAGFAHKFATAVSLVVSFITLKLFRYLLFKDKAPSGTKLVPGPRSTLPWLGRFHDIDATAPWKSMTKWSDDYGGFFRLTTCGGEMHIWVGTAEIAQELYCKRASKYSSRPEVAAVPGSNSQGQYLPLLEHGGMAYLSMHFLSPCSYYRPLAHAAQIRTHCPQPIVQ